MQHAGSVKRSDITPNCAELRTREIELPEVSVLYADFPACTPCNTSALTISTSDSHICVMDLVVDTASCVSILPHSTYARYFSNAVLSLLSARLVMYSKAHIPVIGCLSANVSLGLGISSTIVLHSTTHHKWCRRMVQLCSETDK